MSYKLIKSITDPLIERVKVLEEKIHEIEKRKMPKGEITDTKRLDFMEKNNHIVTFFIGNVDSYAHTIRQAIDAAMRGSDGE